MHAEFYIVINFRQILSTLYIYIKMHCCLYFFFWE